MKRPVVKFRDLSEHLKVLLPGSQSTPGSAPNALIDINATTNSVEPHGQASKPCNPESDDDDVDIEGQINDHRADPSSWFSRPPSSVTASHTSAFKAVVGDVDLAAPLLRDMLATSAISGSEPLRSAEEGSSQSGESSKVKKVAKKKLDSTLVAF